MQSVGMDIGHSAVKIAFTNSLGQAARAMFPSVVCQAFRISDDAERSMASLDTVNVAGREFFVGDTAALQGDLGAQPGLYEDWIQSPQYAALMIAAWRCAQRRSGDKLEDAMLVMGLPTHLFDRQRDTLKEIAAHYLPVKPANIRVMPQGIAPYQGLMLTDGGAVAPGRHMPSETWGVIELGYYTSDFVLMQNGRWVESASGTCPGVRLAAERFARHAGQQHSASLSLIEAEAVLASGELRSLGKRIDVRAERDEIVRRTIDEVIDTANRLIGRFTQSMDGVIVAGGGAGLMHREISQRWTNCVLAERPRFAVAEGMRRFGTAISMLHRGATPSAAAA